MVNCPGCRAIIAFKQHCVNRFCCLSIIFNSRDTDWDLSSWLGKFPSPGVITPRWSQDRRGTVFLCCLTRAKTSAPVVTHEGTEDTGLRGHNQAFYALNKIESLYWSECWPIINCHATALSPHLQLDKDSLRRSVTHPGPGSQLSAIYCLLHYRSDHPSAIWAGSADHTMITARLIAPRGSLSHPHNLMRAAAWHQQLLQSSE